MSLAALFAVSLVACGDDSGDVGNTGLDPTTGVTEPAATDTTETPVGNTNDPQSEGGDASTGLEPGAGRFIIDDVNFTFEVAGGCEASGDDLEGFTGSVLDDDGETIGTIEVALPEVTMSPEGDAAFRSGSTDDAADAFSFEDDVVTAKDFDLTDDSSDSDDSGDEEIFTVERLTLNCQDAG